MFYFSLIAIIMLSCQSKIYLQVWQVHIELKKIQLHSNDSSITPYVWSITTKYELLMSKLGQIRNAKTEASFL